MKVDAKTSAIQVNAYIKQARTQQQPTDSKNHYERSPQVEGTDKVVLSDRAKEVQQAMQTLKTMPDTRAEKVAQVKMEVESGTYKVIGPKVAHHMLRESFENDVILQKINTKA